MTKPNGDGAVLKELRLSLKLSPAVAARQCKVSERTWQRWEKEGKPVPAGVLELFRVINGLDQPQE